ncbi:MAG: universal stress protein, partial [Methylococcaceae bacterium]|nr:universal stress protein [Methylococcaceae bacterium]
MKILVPLDGSESSMRAVDQVIKEIDLLKQLPEIHLINVQHHVGGLVGTFVNSELIKQYRDDEGMAALKPAMQRLDAAGVRYQYRIGVGNEAEVIADYVRETGCDRIIMAARGTGGLARMLLGSVASQVVELSPVPVL